MRQLIEDLISMMEYHVEQTRPIHSTTVALQSAREALKAMPTPLTCNCNQGQVCHICDPIIPPQRKPLTDEDLIECERLADIRHRKHMGSIRGQQLSSADQFLWHYARAIEAAHGIKGDV